MSPNVHKQTESEKSSKKLHKIALSSSVFMKKKIIVGDKSTYAYFYT